MAFKRILIVSACIILSTAQPVQKLPELQDTKQEVLFKEGERVLLECIIQGGKNVKYSWRKDGKSFSPSADVIQRKDEGTLEFLKPTPANKGIYICYAETEFGTTRTGGTELKQAFLNAPKTEIQIQKHKAIEGRPYKLDCEAPEGYPKPTIFWKTQVDGSDKMEDYLNRRITPSPDGTLWFSNVTQEDANPKVKYICVAKSPVFEKEVILAEHYINELKVDSEPNNGDLVPQYVSNDMIAKAGGITMIWCIYGGTPLAHPDWFKDGKNVNGDSNPAGQRVTRHNRTSGRRLLIKETLLEDEGIYKCVANNAVGKPAEHTMKLTVVSPPALTKKLEKQTLTKEGQDVTIPCQAAGVPKPTTTYIFNGQDLKTSDRISTSPEGITIKKVQKSDEGFYGCRVENSAGFEYQETLLQLA